MTGKCLLAFTVAMAAGGLPLVTALYSIAVWIIVGEPPALRPSAPAILILMAFVGSVAWMKLWKWTNTP